MLDPKRLTARVQVCARMMVVVAAVVVVVLENGGGRVLVHSV